MLLTSIENVEKLIVSYNPFKNVLLDTQIVEEE